MCDLLKEMIDNRIYWFNYFIVDIQISIGINLRISFYTQITVRGYRLFPIPKLMSWLNSMFTFFPEHLMRSVDWTLLRRTQSDRAKLKR